MNEHPLDPNMSNPSNDPNVPNDSNLPTVPNAPNESRPSRKALWLAMSSVALAIALVWFAPGIEDHDHEGGAGPGDEAPLNFTLKDMNGIDVKLDSFEGKVVLINFWATWCTPCKAEIPDLIAMQAKYKKDLVVLGISVDDTAAQIKPYASEYNVNYRMLVGNKRLDVQDALGPLGVVPVSILVDRDGYIAKKHTGIFTREQLETEIRALL
jgi:thiol-disulfide isomerase/thioredoxin